MDHAQEDPYLGKAEQFALDYTNMATAAVAVAAEMGMDGTDIDQDNVEALIHKTFIKQSDSLLAMVYDLILYAAKS